MKLTKRQKSFKDSIDVETSYSLKEAVALIKAAKPAKFDETVDIALRLGVDPRKADQMVRGVCALPNGLGKVVRVLAFAKGEKETEAKEAGADFVGGEDLVKKIQTEGWFEFDRVVATPDMMAHVGKIGKLLGPRGLMPNPKVGTVTFEVGKIISSIKAGQVEFRVDKVGNLHAPCGKVSFDADKLEENVQAIIDAVQRLKPSTAKGIYMKNITVSASMGPGVKVDVSSI